MKKTIKDFYRTIKVKDTKGDEYNHTLFDYTKIWEDKAPIFLIISERGAKGKSTQGKKLAKEIYDKEGLKTMWMMNTDILIQKEKKSHLTKPKKYLPELFADTKRKGDFVYADYEDKESWYTRFTSLSTAENEKGSRDDYGLLLYDEFNVGLSNIKNEQTDLISSLIGTLSDPVNKADDKFNKFIIHGNFKSLSNQLLIDLGVFKIENEITNVYVGDFLLMRILSPKLNEYEKKLIEESNKDDWKFLLQKKLGKEGHVYYNENLYDVLNNVNDWMITLPIISKYNLKIGSYYYSASIVKSEDHGNVIYFTKIEEKDLKGHTYSIIKQDTIEGVKYNPNLKTSFFDQLKQNKLHFSSAHIRETIIKTITK